MSTLPRRDPPDDLGLVEAIRSRLPEAEDQLHDVYGTQLRDYAIGLLRGDHGRGAQAVATALHKVCAEEIPAADRLRARLYALVRDECLHRLGDQPAAPPDPEPLPTDPPVALEPGRVLYHYSKDAPGNLEKEAAGLILGHGLDVRELAEVLGCSITEAKHLHVITTTAANLAQGSPSTAVVGLSQGSTSVAEEPTPVSSLAPPAAEQADASTRYPQDAVPLAPGGPASDIRPAPGRAGPGKRRGKRRAAKVRAAKARIGATAVGTAVAAALLTGILVLPGLNDAGGTRQAAGAARPTAPPESGRSIGPPVLPPTVTSEPEPEPDDDPPRRGGREPERPPAVEPIERAPSTPPAPPPSRSPRPSEPAPPPPATLVADDSDCRGLELGLLRKTCTITLTAQGGDVSWAVAAANAGDVRVSAEGSGVLAEGESTSVPVTLRSTLGCRLRDDSGLVTIEFSPGETASFPYECD